jgi:hypothetical protein
MKTEFARHASNTSHRMRICRLARLTERHSKKREYHEAAKAFFFAFGASCLARMTPKSTLLAKIAGLTTETWSLQRLLTEAGEA